MSSRDPDSAHPAIARVETTQRAWGGVLVETAEFWCTGQILHRLPFTERPRLSAILDEVGGTCEPRFDRRRTCPGEHTPRHMHFAPAGMPVWGFTADIRYVRDITLVFDARALEDRLGAALPAATMTAPRGRFSDEATATLLRLLVAAMPLRDASAELYGEGLTTAITGRLFAADETSRRPGLTTWQLRRVVEYLDAHLAESVSLAALAGLTGQSVRHFARAFKASTGQAPHRWHLGRRIARAQALLLASDEPIEEIAARAGFVDAPHFGRVFRRVVGATPGTWRRAHR